MGLGNDLYAAVQELVQAWTRQPADDTSGEDIANALEKLRTLLCEDAQT